MKQRKEGLFDEIIFPGGKTKAFTMSYDDGTIHDRRFVRILNDCGIKATFNLNSGFFGQELPVLLISDIYNVAHAPF